MMQINPWKFIPISFLAIFCLFDIFDLLQTSSTQSCHPHLIKLAGWLGRFKFNIRCMWKLQIAKATCGTAVVFCFVCTLGNPKGAVITHRNMISSSAATQTACEVLTPFTISKYYLSLHVVCVLL